MLDLQSEHPALQWQLLPISPACGHRSAALPSTLTSADRRHPLHDLELARQDVQHRELGAVHMHQDKGTDTVPGHGRGGKFGHGKLSKVLFQLRGMRKYTTFFSLPFFFSVKYPPKVSSMEINLIHCSGRLRKNLLVAAFMLTGGTHQHWRFYTARAARPGAPSTATLGQGATGTAGNKLQEGKTMACCSTMGWAGHEDEQAGTI